jgi:hypothetical protein
MGGIVTYPQPHPPLGASLFGEEHQYRSVNGPAVAATMLIALVVVGEVLISESRWRTYLIVHDYLVGARANEVGLLAAQVDLLAIGEFSRLVAVSTIVVYIAAGVVFLVWSWRARINAEWIGELDMLRQSVDGGVTPVGNAHRLSRGWVIGGWFCPVVNLWFPYQIVLDIWRASAPRRPVSGGLVRVWWLLMMSNVLVNLVVVRGYLWREVTEQALLDTAKLALLSTAILLAAGVLIVIIIWRITTWQSQPRDVA